jgi:hypothetical protein
MISSPTKPAETRTPSMKNCGPLRRPFEAWMIFDYDGVKKVLTDHETFSSRVPAPKNWFIFSDPPAHMKQRALISRAFTPRVIMNLEERIGELSRQLLRRTEGRREMDLATGYSVPLAMMVIAGMIGMEPADLPRYQRWSDVILRLSYSRSGGVEAATALRDFTAVTAEMNEYLAEVIASRRGSGRQDLLTRLIEAELDGERSDQQCRALPARKSASTRPSARRLESHPGRRGGGSAVPLALTVDHAHAPPRCRTSWKVDPRRYASAGRNRFRQSRPAPIPKSRPLRNRAPPQSTPRVRPWHSLLSGCCAFAHGSENRAD